MPKKYAQCRRAAATGIASQRVCAKILELVLGRSTTTHSLDWYGIVVRKLSHILVPPEYWTLGLYKRDLLIRSFRRVVPLEVVSHREVDLKLFIAAVERLFQCGAEDDRDIRKAFCNTHVYCVNPAIAIFKVDLRFVSRSDRPIVRQDKDR